MDAVREIVALVFEWITALGYWGIMLGLMIEVIPSEIVLSFGGYLVSQGSISYIGAVLFGTIGGVIAQWFVYWIGLYGGRPFLEKYGKYLLLKKKHIELSERWFERYGTGVIFTARFIPVVRHAISVPAGIARMPFWRFTLMTTAAVVPWSMFFVYLGMKLGDNWRDIDELAAPYVQPLMIVAGAGMLGYILYKVFGSRKPAVDYGLAGERQVADKLKQLGKEYTVMHRHKVRAGGSVQEFDHIVIGPNGLFHIETKHWSGEIRFTAGGMEREEGKPGEDPTGQLYRHEYVLKELLRKPSIKCDLIGILCFTHPGGRVIGKSPAFRTVKLDGLLRCISGHRARQPMNPSQVKQVVSLIREHLVN